MTHSHRSRAGRSTQLAAVVATTLTLVFSLMATMAGASSSSKVAQAKKTLLALADMPKSWTKEKGSVSGESGFPGASQLTTCIGDTSNLITTDPPEVDSPFFQNKQQTQETQDSVAIFASGASAQAEFSAIANPKTPGCVATYANGSYKSKIESSGGGTKVGTITVSTKGPNYFGPHTSSYTMNIPITSQGASLVLRITSVYFIKGDFGQQITLNSYGAAPDTALLKHLTAVAQHRL